MVDQLLLSMGVCLARFCHILDRFNEHLVGQPRVVLMKTEIYEEKKSPNMHKIESCVQKFSVINWYSSEEEKTYMFE